MKTAVFDEIVNERIDAIRQTLSAKADEYARLDRLSNFKQIANLRGCTPEAALLTLVSKHFVALSDFVNDIDKGRLQCRERWDEKVGDITCYMVLLDALLAERFCELESD